ARQTDEEHADLLARRVDHARRAQRELRHISNELYTGNVGAAALSESLAALVKDFRAAKPDIELIANVRQFEPDVPTDLSVTIYRIAQEALTNVARHAQASEVRVRLQHQGGRLRLLVRDNGIGAQMPQRAGIGLRSISERARCLGGVLRLNSRPGAGWALCLSIPLEGQ
ncbi:sensor histidine kinase, partial [Pseudomonas sp.]|uniref:sensor histidine kinase n=1 Tax=Pseudomonas sp. TaxID=306 RepID=UPI0029BEE40E|nr:sensor histidine kinase [Pseudomonas sp.]